MTPFPVHDPFSRSVASAKQLAESPKSATEQGPAKNNESGKPTDEELARMEGEGGNQPQGRAGAAKPAAEGAATPKVEPTPRSLTDIQSRDWYNGKVAEIDKVEQQMRADGKSPKEIFETTTQLRNDAKMQARDLMQDQDLAKSLPPPKSPEEVLKKYGGDYEKAIAASKRTNPTVNKAIEDRRTSGEQ